MAVLHMRRYALGVRVISVSSQRASEIELVQNLSTPFLLRFNFCDVLGVFKPAVMSVVECSSPE